MSGPPLQLRIVLAIRQPLSMTPERRVQRWAVICAEADAVRLVLDELPTGWTAELSAEDETIGQITIAELLPNVPHRIS